MLAHSSLSQVNCWLTTKLPGVTVTKMWPCENKESTSPKGEKAMVLQQNFQVQALFIY